MNEQLIWIEIGERVDRKKKGWGEEEITGLKLQDRTLEHKYNDCHSLKFSQGGKRFSNRY